MSDSQPDARAQYTFWCKFPGTYREPTHEEWVAAYDQLRSTLSLAEEKLVSYAQEIEACKHDIEQLMQSVTGEANEVERLRAALERIRAVRYGLEQDASDEERAGYWSDVALAYRQIAAEALRGAEPQS